MYSKLLIATDGSELAGKAVDHGIKLAKAVDASILFVTVTELWSPLKIVTEFEQERLDAIKIYEDTATRSAEMILKQAVDMAQGHGLDIASRHVRDKKPAEGIVEIAELENCDLIIMASHGRRELRKFLIGSETAEVLVSSKRPVLVLR